MYFFPYGISLALPLLLMSGCNSPANSLPENSPPASSSAAQSKNFTVEEIEFTFPYPAAWGEVVSERTGTDVSCPGEMQKLLCSTMGNLQSITFSQKNDINLQFFETEDRGVSTNGYQDLISSCQTQPKDEPLVYTKEIGYCGKTEEGNTTFTTLSQFPTNEGLEVEYLPEQHIFYQLEPGKFDELAVSKTLPVSEECRKALADKLALEKAESERCRQRNNSTCEWRTFPLKPEVEKRCIQESMRLFDADAESTQEGREFREFLKDLATAK